MKKKAFRKIAMLVLFLIFIFCSIKVINIVSTYEAASNEYENLALTYTSNTNIPIDNNSSNDDLLNKESVENDNDSLNEESNLSDIESSQENDPIEHKTIDFESLISLNPDIIGWITIPGTVIDYPITLSKDNNEYLKLTFLKEKNSSGAIFVDMRNNGDFSDYNTLIYGHNMKNGSMFNKLRAYKDETFYEEHKYVALYTPQGAGTYAIISCYATTETSPAYRLTFSSPAEYEEWLKEECKLSKYKVHDYDPSLNTITLSTCDGASGSEYRWIMHLQKIY